jgi:uncharacterized membrane protein YjdF
MVGSIAAAVMLMLSLGVARPGSTYRFSFLFLAPMLWLAYGVRRRIHLHPLHFALFAIALLLHDLGAFGFYQRKFFGLEFDLFVHSYFGFVLGLVLYRGFEHFFKLSGWKLWFAVAIFTLGIGGVHELVEWSSTMLLGPERGMLKLDPNDPFDTQKDLFNNLAGAIFASIVYSVTRGARQRRSREHGAIPIGAQQHN